MFSKALGISEKTVEKWEQGANPIKGAASRLLYLIDQDHSLMDKLYRFKVSAQKESPEYLVKRENRTNVISDSENSFSALSNPDIPADESWMSVNCTGGNFSDN